MTSTVAATYKNYIGGQWTESVSGRTYPITNPASKGTVLGQFQTSVAEIPWMTATTPVPATGSLRPSSVQAGQAEG